MTWKAFRDENGLRWNLMKHVPDDDDIGIVRHTEFGRWRWVCWNDYADGYEDTAWGAMSALLRAVRG